MTEKVIQDARKQLTADEAIQQLEEVLISHNQTCKKFEWTKEKWMAQTSAALEWAIELLKEERDGMLLRARFPIGTTVYELRRDAHEQMLIIDGKKHMTMVPYWQILSREYEWIDAMLEAGCYVKYFSTYEEACAEREWLESGGGQDA